MLPKCFAHWITKNYRDAYGMFFVKLLLFIAPFEVNSKTVTIIKKNYNSRLVMIKKGHQKNYFAANLYSKRDFLINKSYMYKATTLNLKIM